MELQEKIKQSLSLKEWKKYNSLLDKNKKLANKYLRTIFCPKETHQKSLVEPRAGRTNPPQEVEGNFQPHNLRLYFDFLRKDFNPKGLVEPTPQKDFTCKSLNYESEFFIENFREHSFRVKKTQIIVSNFIDHKRWYALGGTEEEIEEKYWGIIQKKFDETIKAFKKFMEFFGGKSHFELLEGTDWEEKFTDEWVKKNIPDKYEWRTKISKKVYKKPHPEIIAKVRSPQSAANAVNNLALHKFSPMISERLDDVMKINKSNSLLLDKYIRTLTKKQELGSEITQIDDTKRIEKTHYAQGGFPALSPIKLMDSLYIGWRNWEHLKQ